MAAVLLGLLAALLFATAASLQQRGARSSIAADAQDSETRWTCDRPSSLSILSVARRLVRNRVWLAGWVTNLCGFFTQAAALHVGTLTVVQPVLVTQLLFSLPLAAVRTRTYPRPRDWLAGATICAGVALFVVERSHVPPGAPERSRARLLRRRPCRFRSRSEKRSPPSLSRSLHAPP